MKRSSVSILAAALAILVPWRYSTSRREVMTRVYFIGQACTLRSRAKDASGWCSSCNVNFEQAFAANKTSSCKIMLVWRQNTSGPPEGSEDSKPVDEGNAVFNLKESF
jgi:hypothetical protein